MTDEIQLNYELVRFVHDGAFSSYPVRCSLLPSGPVGRDSLRRKMVEGLGGAAMDGKQVRDAPSLYLFEKETGVSLSYVWMAHDEVLAQWGVLLLAFNMCAARSKEPLHRVRHLLVASACSCFETDSLLFKEACLWVFSLLHTLPPGTLQVETGIFSSPPAPTVNTTPPEVP